MPELDFVMEKDGQLIGQNMFMRAVIQADDGRMISIMTMGPITASLACLPVSASPCLLSLLPAP